MKNFFTLLMFSILIVGLQAQDAEEKDKKESPAKEKVDRERSDKVKGKDDATVFIGEPRGDDYQLEERRAISKPSMPIISIDQDFNQQKKKKEQQDAYKAKEYYYPAKPKNAWQLGIFGGLSSINGDISPNFFGGKKPPIPGFTAGINVKKPINYMFAVRASYRYMTMWNTDNELSSIAPQWSTTVPSLFTAYVPNQNKIAHNSKTVAHDLTFDAIVSFGNVKYHKERTKVVFNIFASAGGFAFATKYDQLDGNGVAYDYTNIDFDGKNRDIASALADLRDGSFETRADKTVEEGEGVFGSNLQLLPAFGGGAGLTFRLNRVLDIEFEGRMMATRSDNLDGMRFEETATLTANFDTYSTFTVGFNFKLVGKNKTEPITLLNPMHYTYQKIAENDPERAIAELLKDDDGDGVPNRLDQEENTPEGAPVSPKGIALDSDKDGIIDGKDDEPFSPPGLPVNDKGVAQLPPDLGNGEFVCQNVVFPSVHFDKDKFNLKPEFYAHLHNLADRMIACANMKIKAIGMTDKDDSEKYNEQLSFNRVKAVIDYLVEQYGIDRNRFIPSFEGEANAKGISAVEQYKERKVMLEQAPDNASGISDPTEPHPKLKAGSDK